MVSAHHPFPAPLYHQPVHSLVSHEPVPPLNHKNRLIHGEGVKTFITIFLALNCPCNLLLKSRRFNRLDLRSIDSNILIYQALLYLILQRVLENSLPLPSKGVVQVGHMIVSILSGVTMG